MDIKGILVLILVFVFCNQCETGTDGVNSLVSIDQSAPVENCPNGGITVYSGLDLNRNNILEPEEISETTYVCTGRNALLRTEIEPEGQNCKAGGYKIFNGIDNNGDGQLNDNEIQDTLYVCHGKSVQQLKIGDLSDPNIVVVDIDPDTLIAGERYEKDVIYNLDLDNDGLYDLRFVSWIEYSPSYFKGWSKVKTHRSSVYVSITDTSDFPKIHKQGDIVNNLNNWESGEFLLSERNRVIVDQGDTMYSHEWYDGIWYNISNKYLAVRIDKESDNLYGWIMISVSDSYAIRVHEYAYKQ